MFSQRHSGFQFNPSIIINNKIPLRAYNRESPQTGATETPLFKINIIQKAGSRARTIFAKKDKSQWWKIRSALRKRGRSPATILFELMKAIWVALLRYALCSPQQENVVRSVAINALHSGRFLAVVYGIFRPPCSPVLLFRAEVHGRYRATGSNDKVFSFSVTSTRIGKLAPE